MQIKDLNLIDFSEETKKLLGRILQNSPELLCNESIKTEKELEQYLKKICVR